METIKEEFTQIKKTKSIEMNGNNKEVEVIVTGSDNFIGSIFIPISKVFQVKRGLESYIQKFYRRHEKTNTKRDSQKT